MKLEALEAKLLQAARNHPPGEQVPYAFAQRIVAHVRGAQRPDPLAFWGRWLWRAAFSSLAIALLTIAWSTPAPTPQVSLADDFEQVIYAGLNEISDSR